MKLCSACLLGIKCRYDGKSKPNKKVIKLAKKEILIPVCPEQLGGLSAPRTACGIFGGDGNDVLSGKAKVLNRRKKDLTKDFIHGTKEVLRIARIYNITEAILRQGSPSCGCGLAFQWKKVNGKWSNRKQKGDGVTTALLKKNGIGVITEEDL